MFFGKSTLLLPPCREYVPRGGAFIFHILRQYVRTVGHVDPLPAPKPQIVRPEKQKGSELKENSSPFVDTKRVKLSAGKGGDGAISFLSIMYNEFAGPDGGDGGNGGHVLFRVTGNAKSLAHIKSLIQAMPGENGMNKDMFGKAAEHTIVDVPIGTIVRDEHGRSIVDLEDEGLIYVAARGGAGGRGNHQFTTATEQAPKFAELGAEGEEKVYILDMKAIANVGLIGFPNAGKSTLLRAMSRARPKVAPYPFTTLRPHVGVVSFSDFEQLAVADIPGLIPDAHKNRGLGIDFLKHVERCSVLVYLIDLTSELPTPILQYKALQYEVRQYKEELVMRPSVVVANKIDVEGTDEALKEFQSQISDPVQVISAQEGTNVDDLIYLLRELHEQVKDSLPHKNEDLF